MKLSGVPATNQLNCITSYIEIDGTHDNAFTPTEQASTTNSGTAVTIVDAPGADSIYLQLKSVSIVNIDTAAVTLTIQLNDTATSVISLFVVTLEVGDNLQYIDTDGFRVLDKNGKVKTFGRMDGSDGQLANAKGTIYTATFPCKIKGITLVSSDNGTYTVNLYVNRAGTSRRIIPKDKSLSDDLQYPPIADIYHFLDTGDLIEGDASSATKVDYLVSVEGL